MDFRPGDWVEVKSAEEIAATLDENGALGGLPFMPEMIPYCGKRLKFARQIRKTCIEQPVGRFLIRELIPDDVVILEEARCSGADHGGCQRDCSILWKTAWLRPVDDRQQGLRTSNSQLLLSKLKTMSVLNRYYCQSTELVKLVYPDTMGPLKVLAQCVQDLLSGAVSFFEMIPMVCVPLYRKLRDRLVGRPALVGTLKRTPVGDLNLQPGELVTVKSVEEIRATLDSKGRNRGLVCDIESTVFCGKQFRVRGRLDRMISEPTGEMKRVEATVLLEGQNCLCARALGGCPRKEFAYWREVWLKRVEPSSSLPPAMTSGRVGISESVAEPIAK